LFALRGNVKLRAKEKAEGRNASRCLHFLQITGTRKIKPSQFVI
jgi:hypothetical protein